MEKFSPDRGGKLQSAQSNVSPLDVWVCTIPRPRHERNFFGSGLYFGSTRHARAQIFTVDLCSDGPNKSGHGLKGIKSRGHYILYEHIDKSVKN